MQRRISHPLPSVAGYRRCRPRQASASGAATKLATSSLLIIGPAGAAQAEISACPTRLLHGAQRQLDRLIFRWDIALGPAQSDSKIRRLDEAQRGVLQPGINDGCWRRGRLKAGVGLGAGSSEDSLARDLSRDRLTGERRRQRPRARLVGNQSANSQRKQRYWCWGHRSGTPPRGRLRLVLRVLRDDAGHARGSGWRWAGAGCR